AGEVGPHGRLSLADAAPEDSVAAFVAEIIAIDESGVRLSLREESGTVLEGGVVVDHHLRRPHPVIEDLEEPSVAAPPRPADILEQVVPDEDPLHGLARVGIVGPQDADPR